MGWRNDMPMCPRHGRPFPCEPCERDIAETEFDRDHPFEDARQSDREAGRYERWLDRIGGSR